MASSAADKTIEVRVVQSINGPIVTLSNPTQVKVQVKGQAGGGPKKIRWKLASDSVADWYLASIEFFESGLTEFEPHPSSGSVTKTKIDLRDRFVSYGSFKYSIWCAPKGGFGRPISLDPIIENIPPR